MCCGAAALGITFGRGFFSDSEVAQLRELNESWLDLVECVWALQEQGPIGRVLAIQEEAFRGRS